MTNFAAVDLGAQSGRVALGRFDGERLSVEELHRFPNEPVLADGRLHWDIRRLYRETLDGLASTSRAADIDALAVDSWAVDFGLVDGDGGLLADPVHYRDRRRANAFDSVLARVPPRELYARTGIQLLPINTIFQLAALVEDGGRGLQVAERILLVPDLLHFWLSGVAVCERTNASTTQCLDPRTGAWATDVLERLGIPAAPFRELVSPDGARLLYFEDGQYHVYDMAAGTSRANRLLNAPRGLNDPVCWNSSSLSASRPARSPKSAGSTSITGVRRTCARMRS